jgi:hypothetical protein
MEKDKNKKTEQKVTKEGETNNKDTHAFMVMGTRFEVDK